MFITTGIFTKDAIDYVKSIDPKVILIDGKRLTEYMIDFNLGTTTSTFYEIKKIDSDYFEEENYFRYYRLIKMKSPPSSPVS